jgi:hypothetical protein
MLPQIALYPVGGLAESHATALSSPEVPHGLLNNRFSWCW